MRIVRPGPGSYVAVQVVDLTDEEIATAAFGATRAELGNYSSGAGG